MSDLVSRDLVGGGSRDSAGASHDSSNLRKYASGGAFYHWQLGRFLHLLYETIARTAPHTVLDAGCGEGFVTRFLHRQNADWSLTGTDRSEGAVTYARQHSPETLRYVAGDLYALPFEDDAFDTVLCSEVLEHLDHPHRAFEELKRVARRAVVVSVPREPWFGWLSDLGRLMGKNGDPGHVNFWTARGFRRFVRSHLSAPEFATINIHQIAAGRVA